jgi:hypothetical protein
VLREDLSAEPLRRAGETWSSPALQAGAYHLQVRGRGIAAARHPFVIQDGETTRLAPELRPGQTFTLRLRVPGGGEEARLGLRIRDALGAEVLTDTPWLWPDAEGNVHPGDFGTEVALAPGTYQVEAWHADGRRPAADLRADGAADGTLVLELR